jgi:hypothetical protein
MKGIDMIELRDALRSLIKLKTTFPSIRLDMKDRPRSLLSQLSSIQKIEEVIAQLDYHWHHLGTDGNQKK